MSYFNDLPQIDRDIIGSIIAETLKAGYVLSVFDGEETTVGVNLNEALTEMACFWSSKKRAKHRDEKSLVKAHFFRPVNLL